MKLKLSYSGSNRSIHLKRPPRRIDELISGEAAKLVPGSQSTIDKTLKGKTK
ncbi:MAG: hypothetical protein J7K40_11140 [candidate division Zixibacteria bacterium]|nr:hypothetical protein [candidate division Zixibacteria bacterium]